MSYAEQPTKIAITLFYLSLIVEHFETYDFSVFTLIFKHSDSMNCAVYPLLMDDFFLIKKKHLIQKMYNIHHNTLVEVEL